MQENKLPLFKLSVTVSLSTLRVDRSLTVSMIKSEYFDDLNLQQCQTRLISLQE